jgi:uncharacterized damage-inducible protein DinB
MELLHTLVRYKAWADRLIHDRVATLEPGVAEAPQPIIFGSIRRTLNHLLAMDQVWRANLEGLPHGLTTRNPADCPPMEVISADQAAFNQWLATYVEALGQSEMDDQVSFTFIGGGEGRMTRGEILLHMVNHSTYHRGHVADMLYHAGYQPPTTDLPVFLRETSA